MEDDNIDIVVEQPGQSDNIEKEKQRPKWVMIALIVTIAAAVIGLTIGLIFLIGDYKYDGRRSATDFEHAVVAADAVECSLIGSNILQKGGNAADAAVATVACTGLFSAHSSGIGGGAFIMYYSRSSGENTFINAREVAPLAATENMYASDPIASQKGGLAIGVPGEVSGMWKLHQQYGSLPWADLFAPSIKFAKDGFVVPVALARAIKSREEDILEDSNLGEIFLKPDGKLYQSGDTMTRPKLAVTLQKIADEGKSAFYSSLAEDIVAEIAEYGGIITVDDLAQYEATAPEPLHITLNDWDIVSPPPPGSGAVLSLILNILEGYDLTPDSVSNTDKSALTYHRMIESFKFAFAKRSGLGDAAFVDVEDLVADMISQDYADTLREKISDDKTHTYEYYEPSFLNVDDSGTAHISIVDENGNACSVTTTVNLYFGSKVRGNRTGIIYNDEMDDFSQPGADNYFGVPPSEENFIVPGKRPLSSMTPTICIGEDGNVMQVQGASGGTRITTAVASTIMFTKWLGFDLKKAIEDERLHDQLIPTRVTYEEGYNSDIIGILSNKGHNMTESSGIAVVQGINRLDDDWFEAHSDSRKGGFPAGY